VIRIENQDRDIKDQDIRNPAIHNRDIQYNTIQDQERSIPATLKKLTWVDFIYTLIGIAILYLTLGLATAWVASWWPYERVLLYVNGFLTQGLFFLIIWLLTRIRGWKWTDFGWNSLEGKTYWGSVLTFYVLTWVINLLYGIYLFQKGFTPPETDVYTQLLGNATIITFILNLILAGILAPILEETIFRGIIYGSLQTYFGKWTAAAISSIIFSGLHFQMHGFFPRFILGMVLCHLYSKYRSLYPSMAMHAVNNIVALVLVALSGGL
jgi:uncharacterized protein